jgi:hypothetical protein
MKTGHRPVCEVHLGRGFDLLLPLSVINDFAKQCNKPKFGPPFLEFGLHWELDTALAVGKGHYLLRLQV